MMKRYITFTILFLMAALLGCTSVKTNNSSVKINNSYERLEFRELDVDGFDDGYEWAEDNNVSDFDKCQDEFGTFEAENGCNEYVKVNYTRSKSFHGYDCTEDCSGHEAGYEWAEKRGISNTNDCGGKSESFIEGCYAYVEENY